MLATSSPKVAPLPVVKAAASSKSPTLAIECKIDALHYGDFLAQKVKTKHVDLTVPALKDEEVNFTSKEILVDSTGIFGTVTHPDTGAVSPLTDMYYIGKGIVSVQILQGITTPDVTYRDVGNVPVFEFTPNITVLSHYSSRLGIRSKDLEVIHEKQATLNMHMDEWSFKNLQLAFMALVGP
jgi:hypothetical protein